MNIRSILQYPRKTALAFTGGLFAFLLAFIITPTSHAGVEGWDAGNIITDAVFTDKNTMNPGDIQNFLNSKVSSCDTWGEQPSEFGGGTRRQWAEARGYSPPYTCLKDYSQDGRSAAQIIYDAAQEYTINPKVFIVLLQKEQGLITDTWPLSIQYRSATGYGCPDTAPCDTEYYGFTNQVRWAARMFRAIMNDSPTWYTPYELGNNFIQYSPDGSCGGSNVYIQNRATQALYNYTPYQPNQAALDAGWGTAHCGAYGNRNFYLYFTSWFGSTRGIPTTPLDNPRWMKVKNSTQKRNPWTNTILTATLPVGTQLRFVDKIFVNNTWYLRTEYDKSHNIEGGIPQTDLVEIEFEPLAVPRYMELSSNAHKVNPRNWVSNFNVVIPAGTTMKFTSKMLVNGQWFFRTQEDEQQGKISSFYSSRIRELTYKNFDTPRYMQLKQNTNRVDVATGAIDSTTLNANAQIKFASKVFAGGQWYYRTATDTTNGTKLAVPASHIQEIPYESYVPNKWMQTKNSVRKVNPASGQPVSNIIPAATKIRLIERINVNGVWYYRSEYDVAHQLNNAIPETELEEMPYVSLESPRAMKLKSDTQKINPKDDTLITGTLTQGTVLTFTTKIEINGLWYLRTASDTDNNLDRALPLHSLEEL